MLEAMSASCLLVACRTPPVTAAAMGENGGLFGFSTLHGGSIKASAPRSEPPPCSVCSLRPGRTGGRLRMLPAQGNWHRQ